MRVAYARRRYKDKVYETPLVVTSYRDENGTPRNKTLANLAKLPRFVVELIEKALKRGDDSVLEEYVHIDDLKYPGSTVIGPSFVALALLKQLGVFELLTKFLTPKQATAILSIIVERMISDVQNARNRLVSYAWKPARAKFRPRILLRRHFFQSITDQPVGA